MKLNDLLNNLLFDGNSSNLKGENEKKAFDQFNEKAGSLIDKIKEIGNSMDVTSEKLEKAKAKHGINSKEAQDIQKKVEELEEDWHKNNIKIEKIVKEIAEKYKLTADQIDNVNEAVLTSANKARFSGLNFKDSLETLNNHANNGFNGILKNVGGNIGNFLNMFGAVGPVVEGAAFLLGSALVQMEELNKKLVEFNREMSQGFSNDMLGMDLYGNGKNGSLRTLAGINNISEDSILEALKAFKKGKTLGLNEDLTGKPEEMTKFAIAAAQLGKFYGIQASTINTISRNLVYNYGTKIKDLSGIFEHGKEVAIKAGVSVSQYFENLKDATNLVGEKYIAGGIKGLNRLAEYATRTDQSIAEIYKSTAQFKNFGSQYENQNKAAGLGLQNTARNTGQAWALSQLGRDQEANALINTGYAKDIESNGLLDDNNNIDYRGLKTLNAIGLDKDQIATVQKLIKLHKEQGITMEQLQDPLKQDLKTRRKIAEFQEKNMTIGEKYAQMWTKVMGQIIDPLANALAPILDVVIDLFGGLADIISSVITTIKNYTGFGKNKHVEGHTEGSDAGPMTFLGNVFKVLTGKPEESKKAWHDVKDNFGVYDKNSDEELDNSNRTPTVVNANSQNGLLKNTSENETNTSSKIENVSFVSTHEKQMRVQADDFWKDMNNIWVKESKNMWGDMGQNAQSIWNIQINTAKSLSAHIKDFFNSDNDQKAADEAAKKYAENKAAGLVYSVQNIMQQREATPTGVAERAQAERLEKMVTQPVHIEIKQAFDGSIKSRIVGK